VETTKPAVAKPVAPHKSAAKLNPKTEIEQTLHAWLQAWSSKDAEAYLAFYGNDFKVPDGRPRDEWAAERKERVTRPEFIKVSIDKVKIDLKGNSATIRFKQRYESNILKSIDKKTLFMAYDGQSWKILEER